MWVPTLKLEEFIFLQRLGAAHVMSMGDWPEEFKIIALDGQQEGPALCYYEKMLPVWSGVSNTLENVMNSMVMLYMLRFHLRKGLSS